MREKSLKQKTLNGAIWSYINQFGNQLLMFVPTMVLTRLITPSDYGIVALSAIFTGFITIFANAGFGSAIIQRKDLSNIDICSVYYCNIFLSIILYAVLFFIAPFCSVFFSTAQLVNVIRISSLGLILSSLGEVQNCLFTRELNLKKPALRNLSVNTIASVIAIISALLGLGYWSLVIQTLIQSSFGSIANWILSSWRPTLCFSFESLKKIFGYGGKIMFKSAFDYTYSKSYDFVIGKVYSPELLSYYNRAYSTVNLFITSFLGVLNSVAFSAFSKIQDDKIRMRDNIRMFIRIEAMVICFIIPILAALAEPFFHFMYSSKWDAAIPLFYLLSIWGLLQPFGYALGNGLMSSGHLTSFISIGIFSKTIMFLLVFVTYKYGIPIMIVGQIISYFIEVLLLSITFNRYFKYSLKTMIIDVSPYFIIGGLISLFIFLADKYIFSFALDFIKSDLVNGFIHLLAGGFIALLVYVLALKKLRLPAFIEFINIIEPSIKNHTKLHQIVSSMKAD